MLRKKIYYLFIVTLIVFLASCQMPSSVNSDSISTVKNIQNASQTSGTAVDTAANVSSTTTTTAASVSVITIVPGNPIKSSAFIQNGNFVYYCNWSDGDKIYKMNLNGTGSQKIGDDASDEMIMSNNLIYYSNVSDDHKLYSINVDGTGRKKILDEKCSNLILIGNIMFYIDFDNNIKVLDTISGKTSTLQIKSRCFDSDGTNIYYENYAVDKLSFSSAKVDGTNTVKVNDDAPLMIVVQSKDVYYINGSDNDKIYKISSNGTGRIKLNDNSASNLVVDNGYIYYINNSDFQKIYKMKLDGTGNTKVCDASFVKTFNIAGNLAYFSLTSDLNKVIYKVNK